MGHCALMAIARVHYAAKGLTIERAFNDGYAELA
jgi:hypothetical protein